MMKKAILAGLSVVVMTASAALAADPWMTETTSMGKVWADANGLTLYTFDKDSAGMSSCYDMCAKNWPPLAAAADAKDMGDWTVVARTDGTKMWAYDGHPLYTFIKDTKAGDLNGDGVGGVWHVAKAE